MSGDAVMKLAVGFEEGVRIEPRPLLLGKNPA